MTLPIGILKTKYHCYLSTFTVNNNRNGCVILNTLEIFFKINLQTLKRAITPFKTNLVRDITHSKTNKIKLNLQCEIRHR